MGFNHRARSTHPLGARDIKANTLRCREPKNPLSGPSIFDAKVLRSTKFPRGKLAETSRMLKPLVRKLTNEQEEKASGVAAGPESTDVYFPGRGVSVRYGWPADGTNGKVGILLFLDSSASGDLTWRAAESQPRSLRVAGPAFLVVAAGVEHTLSIVGEQHVITLLLEPRFVRETAKDHIASVTMGELDA
jgi:hypothetical protein